MTIQYVIQKLVIEDKNLYQVKHGSRVILETSNSGDFAAFVAGLCTPSLANPFGRVEIVTGEWN